MAMAAVPLEGGGTSNKKNKELQTKGIQDILNFNNNQLDKINRTLGKETAAAVTQPKSQPQGTAEALGLTSTRQMTANASLPANGASPAVTPAQTETPAANGYAAAIIPSYQPNTDRIKEIYDAARASRLAELKGAYDSAVSEYEAAGERIAPEYAAQRDAAAAEIARQRQSFNEYSAASGLNSGAAAQAELARNSVLAQNLNALNVAEANAEAELQLDLAKLRSTYESAVAEAIAENDQQRAEALFNEYKLAEQSRISAAEAQADENYRAYTTQYQRERDAVSDEQFDRQFGLKAASASSGSGSVNNASNEETGSVLSRMLELNNDGAAYEYLLGRGYSNDKTNTFWKLYNAAKEGETEAQPAQTSGETSRMLTESEFNGAKSGNHPQWALWYHSTVAPYNTYADYVKDYNRYLSEVS